MFKEQYFKLAYELAERGRGKCSPNPFVGAVIVKDDKIIGKGFTQPYGKDHAEVQAIKDANKDSDSTSKRSVELRTIDSEMYVTLEPCAHFGTTPPCCDAIIQAGIKKVYIGIKDPNPLVNGKGFQKLKEAGIQVETGFWEDKIRKQLEYYQTFINKKRPFVIMKNAVSLDGKIATESGDAKWISSKKSREFVHRLRNEADVILTGIGTVLKDDPLLNVRMLKSSEPCPAFDGCSLNFGMIDNSQTGVDSTIMKITHPATKDAPLSRGDFTQEIIHPMRVILDSNLIIPLNSKIVQTAKDIKTIVFARKDFQDKQKKISKLEGKGIEIIFVTSIKNFPNSGNLLSLDRILNELYKRNYYSVMIEAGSKVCSSFLREKLVDKMFYFISPKIIGGDFSLFREIMISKMDEAIKMKIDKIEKIGDDILVIGYPKKKFA